MKRDVTELSMDELLAELAGPHKPQLYSPPAEFVADIDKAIRANATRHRSQRVGGVRLQAWLLARGHVAGVRTLNDYLKRRAVELVRMDRALKEQKST